MVVTMKNAIFYKSNIPEDGLLNGQISVKALVCSDVSLNLRKHIICCIIITAGWLPWYKHGTMRSTPEGSGLNFQPE
jgi:hypothetical protein